MLKQIDKNSPLPKYYQIGESIKEKIANGEYQSGEKLPTCRVLSEYFNTTLVTVSNAMRQLENDGFISRVQGKGMFVSPPENIASKTSAPKTAWKIGLAMHTRGDLYQNISENLVRDLEKNGIYTIPQPPVLSVPSIRLTDKEKCIEKYIANGLDALVMFGDRHMPYKLLHKYRAHFRQLNFLAHYESCIDLPEANTICCDAFKAGQLAARHLLNARREKFMFITSVPLPETGRKRNGAITDDESYDMLALAGMKAVLHDAGIPESRLTIIRQINPAFDESRSFNTFSELLKHGPWGIFSSSDFRLVQIYKVATNMGLDFKQDFSIVGFYNTSWTEVLHPTLTSISVNEAEISHIVTDCIVNRKIGQRIVVEPTLVVRET